MNFNFFKTIFFRNSPDLNSGENNLDLNDIVALEYLDVVKDEYMIERSKRQSFESRSNMVMTFIGVLSVFILSEVKLSSLFELCNVILTFYNLIKIISGFGIYIFLVITIYWIIKCTSVEKIGNFPVDKINSDLMATPKIEGIIQLALTYKEIVIEHRALNNSKALNLKNSYISSIAMVCCIIVYMSF